jgi:uncharacterized protein YecE (DUF72 family)
MQLYCGTSGFSFKEWKGPFYPSKLPATEMLTFYASRMPAVEINNTFYRLPVPSLIEGWRDKVPTSFRFAIKTPRRISHLKRLKDCEEETTRLFDVIAELGERLGVVLVQLPPHFRVDLDRLEAFLALVPRHVPAAFEFRHESWRDDAVFRTLAAHDAAWVTVDDSGGEPAETLPRTASWTYLRLRGPHYDEAALQAWLKRCEDFERAFVFFKHEDEAAGPAFAQRMSQLHDKVRE